jgi:hypothetical protein
MDPNTSSFNLKAPVESKQVLLGLAEGSSSAGGGGRSNGNANPPSTTPREPLPEHVQRSLVISTAMATYDLAEKEYTSGLVEDAARLFHTASIYLRMAGPLTDDTKAKLTSAVLRSKECARYTENFVLEHYNGMRAVYAGYSSACNACDRGDLRRQLHGDARLAR